MKKIIIRVILILLVVFFVFPVVLMFAVNFGLTKEKSGIGRIVDLQKKDDLVFETTENEVESKEPVSEINFFKKDTKREIKLKYCKKEILTAIDNALNFVRESNVNEIFSHTELLVGNLKPHLIYCLNTNKEGTYNFSKLRENVIQNIDIKFVDNVVTDIYNYDSYHYIRTFFTGSGANLYFGSVVKELDDVTSDELQSVIMIEQIRGTMTNRGFFKEMVKNNILQSFTDFSLGVGGMKITTAMEIEKHLKDPNSEFYLGKKYETILESSPYNKNLSLQKKLTENKNYYHQYLYTGLAIKMIKKQWKERGYDLEDKLGIVATIYNLGLKKSNPNAYPGIGGAEIYIDGKKWYFGELGEKIWISLQRYKG
ncbi:hypothetical protein EOM39_01020 [Candidatus Gracilibacteria bacterium]|nr:hypothetical protein [Candidatus Gracilibacteria bacterium]